MLPVANSSPLPLKITDDFNKLLLLKLLIWAGQVKKKPNNLRSHFHNLFSFKYPDNDQWGSRSITNNYKNMINLIIFPSYIKKLFLLNYLKHKKHQKNIQNYHLKTALLSYLHWKLYTNLKYKEKYIMINFITRTLNYY